VSSIERKGRPTWAAFAFVQVSLGPVQITGFQDAGMKR
jgi:hypothetical protein